jgi:glycosyltransferase involved in cell wall biosynthesis
MRILWVKMGGLWPSTTGGRVRSLRTISELSRRHPVTVITTHGPGDDPEGLARSLSHCDRVISLPYTPPKRGSAAFPAAVMRSWMSRYPVDLWKWHVPEVREQVSALLTSGNVDLCVADFLFAAMNVPTGGRTPVVLFEHNVEYQIWQRLAALERRPWIRALFELEWRKLRAREAEACQQADLTIAVSEDDRRRLEQIAPGIRAASIPTGVDVDYFRPDPAAERPAHLVFSGSMDWHPNEDAVLHFVDAILPRIRAEISGATFTVVGRNPTARVRQLGERTGITVTGTVEDVRPFIAEAAVYVVPLRAGGGTRLKIFEALAMARPVVSTTVGAEGLGIGPGRHYVAADDPDAFAGAVVALLRDPARRCGIGDAGRRLVESCYAWPTIARAFEQRCEEVVAQHVHPQRSADRRAHLSRGGPSRLRRPRVVAGEHNEIGWSSHHP